MAFSDLPRDAQKAFFAKLEEKKFNIAGFAALLAGTAGIAFAARNPAIQTFLGRSYELSKVNNFTPNALIKVVGKANSSTMIKGIEKMSPALPPKAVAAALNFTPDLRDSAAMTSLFKKMSPKKAQQVLGDLNREVELALDAKGSVLVAHSDNLTGGLMGFGKVFDKMVKADKSKATKFIHSHPTEGIAFTGSGGTFSAADVSSHASYFANLKSYTMNDVGRVTKLYKASVDNPFPRYTTMEAHSSNHIYRLTNKVSSPPPRITAKYMEFADTLEERINGLGGAIVNDARYSNNMTKANREFFVRIDKIYDDFFNNNKEMSKYFKYESIEKSTGKNIAGSMKFKDFDMKFSPNFVRKLFTDPQDTFDEEVVNQAHVIDFPSFDIDEFFKFLDEGG